MNCPDRAAAVSAAVVAARRARRGRAGELIADVLGVPGMRVSRAVAGEESQQPTAQVILE
jgi:hypothetical protein